MPQLLEGHSMEYSYSNTSITEILDAKTESLMKADNSTHLVIYLLSGNGGGEAHTNSPCNTNKKKNYIIIGCGINGFRGMISCSRVMYFLLFLSFSFQ